MKERHGLSLLVKPLLFLLIAGMLLSGCTTPSASSTPSQSGSPTPGSSTASSGSAPTSGSKRFVVAQTGDIQKLVPFQTTDAVSGLVIDLISEGLVGYVDDYQLEARLATEWTHSEDYLTWTFTLREGVKFHDGSPFTSADVKFTYDSLKDPTQGSNQTKEFEFVDSVETPNDYTVIFNLKYPYGPVLNRMTMAIVSKTYVQAQGFDKNKYVGYTPKAVGTGPYIMKDWLTDDHVDLVANKDYWGGKPDIDEVTIRVITDNSVRLAAFEKGEVDYIFGIPVEDVDKVSAIKDKFTVFSYPQFRFYYMTWNNRLPLFQDPAFRQALTYATNKDSIIKNVVAGHGIKSASPYAPSHPYFNPNVGEPYPYSKEMAIKTLEEAGYTKGADGIYVNPEGIRCSFETVVVTGTEISKTIAELLQAWFKEIGVELTISQLTSGQIYDTMDAVIAGTAPEESYVSMMGSMGTGVDPDMTRYMHTSGGLNDYRYTNERIDELLNEGVRLVDKEERQKIYDEVQQILAEDLPCLMLYFPESNNAVSNKIEGMTATPFGQVNALKRLTMK